MNVILHKDYHVEQNDFINAGRASSQIKNTLKQIAEIDRIRVSFNGATKVDHTNNLLFTINKDRRK